MSRGVSSFFLLACPTQEVLVALKVLHPPDISWVLWSEAGHLVLGPRRFLRRGGIDLRAPLAGLFQGGLLQLALRALGFLHFAFFQALHFLLAFLKCRRQSLSS
jgi:hypothetical protein